MNSFFFMPEEIAMLQADELLHSSFKPLLQSEMERIKVDYAYSIEPAHYLENLKIEKNYGSLLERKLFHEHLFIVDKNDFQLSLDPLFDFSLGKEAGDDQDGLLYKNMRGFLIRANIGRKVSLQSAFRENQARFGSYITENIMATRDALGQGKVRDLDDGGFDFSMASAYVSYSPSQTVNLQMGHGKHFVGNGIRSHFLSDRPYNYPFLRLNTQWFESRLKYTNLYASLQDIKRLPYADREGLLYRKMANFIYLDYALSKNFYIGFFEGRLWETVDTLSGENVLPATAYIPIIGVNTLVDGLGNRQSNATVGINIRYDLGSLFQIYAQGALHAENDVSGQLGVKFVAAKNLLLQLEYNHRKIDSTAAEDSKIQYAHYSRALAFDKQNQLLLRADFRYGRFIVDTEWSYYSNFYKDILYSDINLGYIINPAMNFSCNFGVLQRLGLDEEKSSGIFYVSLRTNLQNIFYDI